MSEEGVTSCPSEALTVSFLTLVREVEKKNFIGKGHVTEVGWWCRKTSFEISSWSFCVLRLTQTGKGLQATPVNEPTFPQQESKFSKPADQVFLGPRAETN